MPTLIRTTLFSVLFLLFGASVALGQTYELVADQSDLTPSAGPPDAQCVVEASNGTLVFFNTEAGGIYAWNGSLVEHTSPSQLNSNISDESGSIDRCDAVAIGENDVVYFSLRSSSNDVNFIYRTDVADATTYSVKEVNGINGLSVDGSTLYLAGVADFGATRNGVFETPADLSGDTTAVATNSNVDLRNASIGVASDGTVYGWSSGSGNFQDVIVSVDPSATSPSFSSFVDPYASGTLTDGEDGDNLIGDLDVVDYNGTEFIVVYNGSYNASNGDEWGTIQISDQSVELLFTRADLTSNLGVSNYVSAFTEPTAVNSSGEVTVASREAFFGGSYYLATVSDAAPLPVEMAGFDAVQNGGTVELRWQTASETNNAGFNIQHKTDRGWTTLGFVESKASAGTATEALSYRYTVGRDLDPGTHRFRLEQTDLDGSTSLSSVETVDVSMDAALRITAPAPNPAAGITTFSVGAKEAADATVALYNVLGQRVKTLSQRPLKAGQMRDVTFDASALPSGIYFVRLQANGQTRTERLTVVR